MHPEYYWVRWDNHPQWTLMSGKLEWVDGMFGGHFLALESRVELEFGLEIDLGEVKDGLQYIPIDRPLDRVME